MQLFSRKKALFAASLSALVALGACGDNVTVPVAPAAPVTITITPPSANMNVGETLNFAVQINGGSTTPTLASCTSSNTAVATVAVAGSACAVTARASGNASITAATSTGQVAAAAVTVAAPAPAISGLSLSPAAANVAVGGKVTITANPSTSAAGVTLARTYTSSSTSIATVATTGEVTGVAPGTATITVTLTGSGTGLTTTSVTGSVTITVTALPAGVTAVNVTPQAISLVAAQSPAATQQITATATQPTGAAAATFTYGTNNPAVATVSATGLVTAAGPGSAIITVTASSAANASFSASTATAQVPVTVGAPAQVIINSLSDNGAVIDITNVAGQFEVNLSLAPNGQNVSSVQAYVCDQGEAAAACIARGPAAQQTFGSAGGQAGPIQLYINSAEFTTPDFTTGADANTLYKNGLKTIVATLTTTTSNAQTATNNLSAVNFNNLDGWTIRWTQPANKANDAAGNTWYGGPTTPDPLTPSAVSGLGSFVVVPVVYTPNRTVQTATLNISGLACGSNIIDSARPFGGTYGTQARSTANVAFNCGGAASDLNGYVPSVISAIDNNNAAYQAGATGGTLLAATSIFTPISAAAISSPTFAGRYRQSLSYRPTTIYIPGDYQAPTIVRYDVKGSGGKGTYVDSGWVNAAYIMAGGFSSSTGNPTRLEANDNTNGVGLLGTGSTTSSRNTRFNVCNMPSPIPATAPFVCSSPVASGGITTTVGGMSLGENATDFTNAAYVVQVVETDRLGNRVTSNPFAWDDGNGNSSGATPGWALQTPITGVLLSAQAFGVDVTSPTVVTLPNSSGTNTNPVYTDYVRTDLDSIYSTLGNTYGTTNANNAVFAVRFNDLRSGFTTCTNSGTTAAQNCPSFSNNGQVNSGTFQISRVTSDQTVSLTNTAIVEDIIRNNNSAAASADRRTNVINANVANGDPGNREFSINIFGAPNRVRSDVTLSRTPAATVAGYYTFTGTLQDRAGNTTTITKRSVAIDNAAPQITGILVPAIMQGAATNVAFVPSGTDDLEVIAGDLRLDYPQLANNGLVAVNPGQPIGIRFRRVANFSSTAVLGLWHNPFAAITDGKLTTPVGPGLALSSGGLVVPIPFIQQIQSVDGSNAPLAPNALTAAAMKPNQVTAWLYDIRATTTSTGTPGSLYAITGISGPQSAQLFDGQITQPSVAKNWTATDVGTNLGVGIQQWFGFDMASPSSVEFRVATSTSVTNPPFTRVEMIRAGASEWTHLGQAVYAGSLDQGATRYWRYTFSFAGISQGQGNVAALANLDVLRAVGVDAAGNALSTMNWTVGGPVNAVTSLSVSPAGPVFVPSNGATNNYQLVPTITQPSGAVTASVTYAVLSNTGFTIDPIQLASGNVSIATGFAPGATATIRVSAIGTTSTGFIGNTVIKDVVFTSGVAGISAVTISGVIPTTLFPGSQFTLAATATQPVGAPTPTYTWTTPAGMTQTTSGNTATFTWTGTQSTFNSAGISITATGTTAQLAPGFSAGAATSAAFTPAGLFNGFWNTDLFDVTLSIVGQTIAAGATNQLTVTQSLNPVDVPVVTQTCASSAPAAATISNTGLITANGTPNTGFTAAQQVTFQCTMSRNSQTVGTTNFFTRSVSSNTVSALLLPFGLQDLTLSPTSPASLSLSASGFPQTLIIGTTPVTATGASAVTYGAISSTPATATVAVVGNVITVTSVAPGTTTITVTGTTTSTLAATVGNQIVRTFVINVVP